MASLYRCLPRDDFSAYQALVPHIQSLIQCPQKQADTWEALMKNHITYLRLRGKENEAKLQLQNMLNNYTESDGPEDPIELSLKSSLLVTHRNRSELYEGEKLGVELVQTLSRVQGETGKATIEAMKNLAVIYANLNRYEEATMLLSRLFDAIKQPEVVNRNRKFSMEIKLLFAGRVLTMQKSRLKEAEEMIMECIQFWSKVNGKLELEALSELAYCYAAQDEPAKVEEVCLKVLNADSSVLSYVSYARKLCLLQLYGSYKAQGHPEKGKQLFSETLQRLTTLYGKAHPYTLYVSYLLASTWRDCGSLENAIDLYRETLALQRKLLSKSNRDLNTTRKGLEKAEAMLAARRQTNLSEKKKRKKRWNWAND